MPDIYHPYGEDSLGKFRVWETSTILGDHPSDCGICGEKNQVAIVYRNKPKVSQYVAKARSLLIRNKRTGNFIRTIGINCGCYAKVHRQIAHIEHPTKG